MSVTKYATVANNAITNMQKEHSNKFYGLEESIDILHDQCSEFVIDNKRLRHRIDELLVELKKDSSADGYSNNVTTTVDMEGEFRLNTCQSHPVGKNTKPTTELPQGFTDMLNALNTYAAAFDK